ncbi:MAG: hypothetical protein DCC55_31615 [Chloroflexi bacterium]|nr:MAG: hypothetical protein DCC55_31615 [Chloroflexota bacterium]
MNLLTEQVNVSRRAFLKGVAALSALAGAPSLLAACAPVRQVGLGRGEPEAPAADLAREIELATQPRAANGSTRSRVAFVQTTDRAEGVRQAIALLGMPAVAGKDVLLKPNFNSADPAPGSTHPAVLRTLVETLWADNARAITVADRSGMGNTRRVMEQLGVFDLARELDFAPVILDDLPEKDWELIQSPDLTWRQGFPVARPLLEADAVVQACCLKTHQFGGHFTLSLKNSVGLVAKVRPGQSYDYMNELHGTREQRRLIAEINTAYTPALIVMDGVEAFVNGGPHAGQRVAANVVLASTDRIAIDAVGVALLRHFGTTPQVSEGAIFAQEQIARAVELGLGAQSPDQIELVTGDPASEAYAAQIEALLYA